MLNLNTGVSDDMAKEEIPIRIKPDTNEEMDFDLDELTADQKAALEMFDNIGKMN